MNEKGLTLVEVMVTTLIMTVIMGSIMMALGQGNAQVAYELPRDDLDQTAGAVLERIGLVLRNARFHRRFDGDTRAVSVDGTQVAFRTPIEDGDAEIIDIGDVSFRPLFLDGNFAPVFGVIKGLGTVIYSRSGGQVLEFTEGGTGTIMYERLVVQGQPVGLSEPELRVNINGNTEQPDDMDDEFDLGELVFTADDDNDGVEDWRMTLGGGFLLQPRDDWGGDIDGDGTVEPIFQRRGDYLEVTLFMGRVLVGVPPILMRRRITILLRNQ